MMKYSFNDVAETSDRLTLLNGIWLSGLLRSPLEQSELLKWKTLPHSGGKWSATAMRVWPGAEFGQSTIFFTTLLGLCLNFHVEQEGELMLHYEPGSSCRKSKTGDPEI